MDIHFYQTTGSTPADVEGVLPKLVEELLRNTPRIAIVCPTPERRDRLNERLWTFRPDSFIPHGAAGEPFAEQQPVLLVLPNEKPTNNASILVNLTSANDFAVEKTARIIDLFDASESQTKAARVRWKHWKEQGTTPVFFTQTDAGWIQK